VLPSLQKKQLRSPNFLTGTAEMQDQRRTGFFRRNTNGAKPVPEIPKKTREHACTTPANPVRQRAQLRLAQCRVAVEIAPASLVFFLLSTHG